ncbi:MAG: hypothetical protein U1F76_22480 [Candidatus Competibacteraceae bacterium]
MPDTSRSIPWLDPSPAMDDAVNQVRAPATQRATRPRLNLPAIESSLRTVQRAFPAINAHLQTAREPLSDEVITNLMAGYAWIDAAIVAGLNLFALGNLKYLLDLNRRVLCGTDPGKLKDYADHLAATEAHFYSHTGGGIGHLVEWLAGHRHRSPWRQAAGVYIRILSEPQLYLEGNHRCGALLMSYLLAREGKPPFVLTVDNAKAYFDPSTVIKATRKTSSFAQLFTLPHLGRELAQFLKAQADEQYLR